MLGDTDETHIIRTIEYWDNEKRRWPQRQHFAVLVAEHINRRFFNVIHLLSHSIPIIAIQASLLECDAQRSIFFLNVLDTFEEVEDGTSLDGIEHDHDYWVVRAKWTLETAETLWATIQDIFKDSTVHYVKYYVSISVGGNNYFWLHKRSAGKSLLGFRISHALHDQAEAILDDCNIPYVKNLKRFSITVDRQ